MIRFSESIDIEASVEAVFDYISTGENLYEWDSSVKSIKRLSDVLKGLGTKYIMMRELPQGKVFNKLEVIEFKPNQEFKIKTTSGTTPFTHDYIFNPKNGVNNPVFRLRAIISDMRT